MIVEQAMYSTIWIPAVRAYVLESVGQRPVYFIFARVKMVEQDHTLAGIRLSEGEHSE